jgi:hypothetical protein
MKCAIIGSRTFNDYELMKTFINSLKLDENLIISEIISGGAKGADKLGEKYALENKIEKTIFLPDWNTYGKSAGFIRNHDIINTSDIVIAFWDKISKGTKHSIDLATKLKKKIYICYYA